MESNHKVADDLAHLLSIANDGKEGYKNAAENVESAELKALFTTYSIQRSEFEMELKSCIHQLGSHADNSHGGPLGALHRAWIDIKSTLAPNDNTAVLNAVITGEKTAIEAYSKALEKTELSTDLRRILEAQKGDIEECLRNVEKLEQQFAHD